MPSPSATIDLAHEIAEHADVELGDVWTYFAFRGRLTKSVQWRISTAEVEILGLGRDRDTRRKKLLLMALGDFYLETEGQTATTFDAA